MLSEHPACSLAAETNELVHVWSREALPFAATSIEVTWELGPGLVLVISIVTNHILALFIESRGWKRL